MIYSHTPADPTTVTSRVELPLSSDDRPPVVRSKAWIALFGLVACFPSVVSAQHVHGVIELGVVIEGETLAVTIDAPLSDVVGFEHAPADDDQAARLKTAAAIIAGADTMFGVPEAAVCIVSGTEIKAPAYLLNLIPGAAAGAADHDDHHDHHAGHDHEDHDHDAHDHDGHDHDHDEHDHDHSDEHAELNATYQWECSSPSELDALALSFVNGFTSVESVQVQLLTADGAQVMNLTGEDTSLPLK